MANKSASRGTTAWEINESLTSVTSAGASTTINIPTAGSYLDKDIKVTVSADVDTATETVAGTASSTVNTLAVGTKTSGKYAVTGSADIDGTATATVTKSGFVAKDQTFTGAVTGTASVTSSITAAAATVSGSTDATTPTVAIDAANDTILAGTITTDKTKAGTYYAAVKATAPATTVALTKKVDTAGYLGSTDEITASASTKATTGADYYVPITASSLGNAAKTGVTYSENTTVTIPSEGALYIEEGYTPAIKITLDQMLDGKADTAGTSAPDIRSGKIAYDVDGKKLTGTMGTATIVPTASCDASSDDVAFTTSATAPTSGYYITHTATAAASVTNNGYAATTDTITSGTSTEYIKLSTAALTHANTATETQAKAGVKTTATGVKTTTTATSYYVTTAADTTKNTAGSVKHVASVTEGYVPEAGLSQEATIPTSAGVVGTGTTYFQTKNVAATASATTGYTAPTLLAAAPDVPYVTVGTNVTSDDLGKVVSGTTNQYLKIFNGTYSV